MLPYIHGFSYKWCFYNLCFLHFFETTISVPLYTTIILCSCVVLMAEVTTSLSTLNGNSFCP